MAGEALPPRGAECEQAHQWASLRADGELTELESAVLDRHLEACPACRSFAGGLVVAVDLIRSAPFEQPALEFELPKRSASRVPIGRRSAIVAVAAAAAFGSFVGSWLQRPASSPAPSRAPQVSFLTDHKQILDRHYRVKPQVPAPKPAPGGPREGLV